VKVGGSWIKIDFLFISRIGV